MSTTVILKAEGISKQYRLGSVGTGTVSHDLNRWWAKIRGKEDPYLRIGETNDRSTKATSDYVWALQDISFDVKKGEVLGIIGKNGAGKSTLLKILSRVTAPTTGVIKTKGRIASLLEVGTGFNGEMTGRENIFLNGAILGMTKKEIKSKIDAIIEFSGCERYIDTPVKRYSSGMTVRLAFAVAAFLEPEILVIDEVLAVGDAEFQKKAIGKMQDISRGEGRTVIFVSHNMAAVKSLCTRGIVMEHGKVVFGGGIDSAVEKYLTLSSKQFVLEKNKIDKSNQMILINEVSVLKKANIPFQSGESIEIGDGLLIDLKLTALHLYKDISISIDVLNTADELVSHLTNDDDGMYIDVNAIGQELSFMIEIKKIMYIPGQYKFNLWIGHSQQETLFQINNFLIFGVEQGQITKRTKALPSHSKVYTESKWSRT